MKRVYFIKPVGMDGPIKIGCSRSPTTRRAALATWSPFALEIVAEIDGDHDIERRFHAKFRAQHERREWFTWSEELEEVITAIQAGRFDVASLPEPVCITAKGNRTGRKWTEEEKDAVRRRNKHRRIQRDFGLCLPWPYTPEDEDRFFADPHRYGITDEERRKRWNAEAAARELERARAALAKLESMRMATDQQAAA